MWEKHGLGFCRTEFQPRICLDLTVGPLAPACKRLALSAFICKVGGFGSADLFQESANLFCKRPDSTYFGITDRAHSLVVAAQLSHYEKTATDNT